MRLSALISKKYNISRRQSKKLIFEKKVKYLDSIITSDIDITFNSDDYTADISARQFNYNINDYIIKKDNSIIFFYKPPFMHTERLSPEDNLCISDLLEDFKDFKLISRLDYAVDGIVTSIRKDLNIFSMDKNYIAWVEGYFPEYIENRYLIDAHKRRKVKVYEDKNGSLMKFSLIKKSDKKSLIKINIASAARHQVRSVLAYMRYPIIGDYIYNTSSSPQRILLHCSEVFINTVQCKSPEEENFKNIFTK